MHPHAGPGLLRLEPRARASIMVTGSHIPFDRNGYKLNTARRELLKSDEGPIGEFVARKTRARIYAEPSPNRLFAKPEISRRSCDLRPRTPPLRRLIAKVHGIFRQIFASRHAHRAVSAFGGRARHAGADAPAVRQPRSSDGAERGLRSHRHGEYRRSAARRHPATRRQRRPCRCRGFAGR